MKSMLKEHDYRLHRQTGKVLNFLDTWVTPDEADKSMRAVHLINELSEQVGNAYKVAHPQSKKSTLWLVKSIICSLLTDPLPVSLSKGSIGSTNTLKAVADNLEALYPELLIHMSGFKTVQRISKPPVLRLRVDCDLLMMYAMDLYMVDRLHVLDLMKFKQADLTRWYEDTYTKGN